MKSTILISFVFVSLIYAQKPPVAEIPTCGLHATKGMHDCKCAARVAKIRHQAVSKCIDNGDATAYNKCVRGQLSGLNHCAIAERWQPEYDGDTDSGYVRPEGDHVKTPMGEYCMKACAKHVCQCAEEESCSF
jgi:hypothetical protein